MRQANCFFHVTIVDFVWYTLILKSLSPFVCFCVELVCSQGCYFFRLNKQLNLFFFIIVWYLLVFGKEVPLWTWHCSKYQMYCIEMVNLQQQFYAYQTSNWITFQNTSPQAYICYQVYSLYIFVNSVFLDSNQSHCEWSESNSLLTS